MSDTIPAPRIINGIIASTSVTYTASTMLVQHKIKVWSYLGAIVFAIAIFVISTQFDNEMGCVIAFLCPFILFFVIPERSYCYEFDKERKEIRCKWGGFLGIFVDKPSEITYPLSGAVYILIRQIPRPGYYTMDYFKLKIVLPSGKELELPSGTSLGQCMEYANVYKDFLELQTPIRLPE